MAINRISAIRMIYQALYRFSAHSELVEPANKDRKIESIVSGNLTYQCFCNLRHVFPLNSHEVLLFLGNSRNIIRLRSIKV